MQLQVCPSYSQINIVLGGGGGEEGENLKVCQSH